MPDYSKAKIYKIVSPSHPEVLPYYGSTVVRLSDRMSKHRDCYRKGKGKEYITSVEVCQYEDAMIILVENYPCNSKEELIKREYEIIQSHPCVNKIKGNAPDWRKAHPAEAYEQGKKYREKNKERIGDYLTKYREEHRERAKEYAREYRKKNKIN